MEEQQIIELLSRYQNSLNPSDLNRLWEVFESYQRVFVSNLKKEHTFSMGMSFDYGTVTKDVVFEQYMKGRIRVVWTITLKEGFEEIPRMWVTEMPVSQSMLKSDLSRTIRDAQRLIKDFEEYLENSKSHKKS